jgi:hypothetical protein
MGAAMGDGASRSVDNVGNHTEMTRRIASLHIPFTGFGASGAHQFQPPSRPGQAGHAA